MPASVLRPGRNINGSKNYGILGSHTGKPDNGGDLTVASVRLKRREDGLLVHNLSGSAQPWQLLDVAALKVLELLDKTFATKRPIPAQYDPDKQDVKPETEG